MDLGSLGLWALWWTAASVALVIVLAWYLGRQWLSRQRDQRRLRRLQHERWVRFGAWQRDPGLADTSRLERRR